MSQREFMGASLPLKRFSSVRARIFLWYMGLLTTFVMLSVPFMIRFVYAEVDRRVREDFQEDVAVFQGLLKNEPKTLAQLGIANQTLPPLQQPEDLVDVFNLYFSKHVPEDDTFVLGIINQEFYRASPEALPPTLQPEADLIQSLVQLKEPTTKTASATTDKGDEILYIVSPIQANDRILGRLIVVHWVTGEREEALMTLRWVFTVLAIAFALSVGATAIVAGFVLRPLKAILSTARNITESNLTERVPITTQGELAQLGQAINAMMDRLESSFMSQRAFINDAGHELRTPITIMLGHLELMDTSQLPEEEKETIPLVLDELGRMERLVNDLILLAKSERPDFLQFESFDMADFISELFLKMQGLTSENRDWQCQSTVMGMMWGDRQRLTQGVMNLAQNAVQHTQKGDHICLGASTTDTTLTIWLEDSGEGIDPKAHARIFERFARVQYTQRRSDGSGLGLAIVKQIVEAHHGHIQLQSQPAQGSKFVITLPIKK